MMSGSLFCKNCFKKKFKSRGKYDDITDVVPGTQDKPKTLDGKPKIVKEVEEKKAEEENKKES